MYRTLGLDLTEDSFSERRKGSENCRTVACIYPVRDPDMMCHLSLQFFRVANDNTEEKANSASLEPRAHAKTSHKYLFSLFACTSVAFFHQARPPINPLTAIHRSARVPKMSHIGDYIQPRQVLLIRRKSSGQRVESNETVGVKTKGLEPMMSGGIASTHALNSAINGAGT